MTEPSEEEAVVHRRGKWSQPGVPHKGWSCVEVEDLGEVDRACQMCESREIRYAHHMSHPQYAGVLVVGCVCAGHMEGDVVAARERDQRMVSRAARRSRWLARRWKTSGRGNEWLRADGFRVTVYPKAGAWAATVASEDDDSFIKHSQRRYVTSDAAKLAAFDLITRLASSST
jgi:hypothetical protein